MNTSVDDLLKQRIAERNAPFVSEEPKVNAEVVDVYAEDKAKIRAVMGEFEWNRNNGHICNMCAIEANVSLRCRCMWKCLKHSSPSELAQARKPEEVQDIVYTEYAAKMKGYAMAS